MTLPSWNATRGTLVGAPGRVLCIDPGITTGWAYFVKGELKDSGEIATLQVHHIVPLLKRYPFDALVIEGYRIYLSKLNEHINSSVYTVQLIGAVEMWRQLFKPKTLHAVQYAKDAKPFVTDTRLKAWGMYVRSRHARDAVRHGCYYLCFGTWKPKRVRTR